MKYKTRGNSNPQGKPHVYFTGHPADAKLYFENITEAVLKLHNCAVFYDEDPEHPEDAENFISDLDRMQLIVLVVTSRYVYGDTFAHNTVFQHAMERHIPVLPILEERGIEGDFDKKCGDLQYLDPNAKDATAISFEEKLKKFLDSVLVGDELAAKVRAAFDAYVFLSYRKKDRRYAQQLMRLIHQNPFCRDVAIWYDEFLVPGENFNDAIHEAMEKSKLFALVVTPSLLENPNYIMNTEYPAAREAGMPVLPAMLVSTDSGELAARYKNIPKPIDLTQKEVLSAALHDALTSVTTPKNNDDPQHIFFIGLAYLGGIDVEVNYEFAVQLITRAAEAGLPEAIEKLVSMYRTGEGVAHDYHTAIHWQEKLVEVRHAAYESAPTEEGRQLVDGLQWFNALLYLGDFWYELRHFTQASKVYHDMLEASRVLNEDYYEERLLSVSYERLGGISRAQWNLAGAKAFYEKGIAINEWLVEEADTLEAKGLVISERFISETDIMEVRRNLSISYHNLGDISQAQGDLVGAKTFYKKGLAIFERLAEGTGTMEAQRDLSVSYDRLGDIGQAQRDLVGAKAFYEKGLAIRKRIESEMGTVEARRNLSISYDNLGDISQAQGDLAWAKTFYEKCFAIRERLAEETGTVEAQRDLSVSYNNLGDISQARGELAEAKAFYEKCLAIRERLAEETGTVEARRDLSVSYNNLGDISHAQGDLTGAKAFYEKGLAIRERLAEETGTVEARRRLFVSYNRLGNIGQVRGDLAGAKTFYEKCLAISERLSEETGTVEARQDLSASYNNLGNNSRAQGDLAGAKAFYEKCIAIREQLAEEIGTIEADDDLAVSYYNMFCAVNTAEEEQEYLCKAEMIWSRLAAQCPDVPLYVERLAIVREYIR